MTLIRIQRRVLPCLLILAFLFSSCAVAPDTGTLPSEGSLVQTIPPATLTALSAALEPSQTPEPQPLGLPWSAMDGVELEFWTILEQEQHQVLADLAERFNSENGYGITVTTRNQAVGLDPISALEAVLLDGITPQVMVVESGQIAGWHQQGWILDLSPYLTDPAAGYSSRDVKDFYSPLWESFQLADGTRPGLPFSQSIQALFYNRDWAAELGYPTPPSDLEDLIWQACAANSDAAPEGDDRVPTAGLQLSPAGADLAAWIFAYQETGLLTGSGYSFNTPALELLMEDWNDILQRSCGEMSSYPDPMAEEELFKRFSQRKALIVMGPSSRIGSFQMGPSQTGRADQWELLPVPGPGGEKGVAARVLSLVIFEGSEEEQLAAWIFIKYLMEPDSQAVWVQSSGEYPTNKDSLRLLRDFREENPGWSRGLNLLKYARSLPLDPSWSMVRLALGDAFAELPGLETEQIPAQLEMLDQVAGELWELSQQAEIE